MNRWVLAVTTLFLPWVATAQSAPAPATAPPAAAAAVPPVRQVVIPAGTKILLTLKSPVNTKTAQPGDPVYLTSGFPVIVGDHVILGAGMDVLGVIDSVVRPGRVKGRAQVTMHFTQLILPNGTVVGIPGSVYSVPGAEGPKVKGQENTIQQASGTGQDARNIETDTLTGAGVGGFSTIGSGNMAPGIGYGALAGGAGGVAYTLLTRGKDVVLQVGQPLEMELQRPLLLDEKNAYVPPVTEGPQFVPSPNQPKPLPKPQPNP